MPPCHPQHVRHLHRPHQRQARSKVRARIRCNAMWTKPVDLKTLKTGHQLGQSVVPPKVYYFIDSAWGVFPVLFVGTSQLEHLVSTTTCAPVVSVSMVPALTVLSRLEGSVTIHRIAPMDVPADLRILKTEHRLVGQSVVPRTI